MVVLICTIAGCARFEPRTSPGAQTELESGQRLLITARQSADIALAPLGDPGSFYLRRRGYGPTPEVNRTLNRIARDYGLRRVEGWYISSIGQYCEVYELRPDQEIAELIERIGADPRVELVQSMNVFETQSVRYDDPFAPMQPALSALAIESAHMFSTGEGVTVAVVDSGIDRRHPEFRGRVQPQQNLVDQRNLVPAEVHGTAVAGVIGSAANNGEGIVGIAPDSTIASLRACRTVDETTGRAQCSSFSLAQALESAIRLEADVINLSLSGPDDPLLMELIDAAIDGGIIIVAAFPEDGVSDRSFPSSHPRVIAVESLEHHGRRIESNLLRAPGAEVMSTVPNNRYAFFSGSSMSAAYIAGVSALLRASKPGILPEEVFELLEDSGEDGAVNACRALAAAAAADTSC